MIGFGGSFTPCQDFTDILVSLLGCFLQGPRHLGLLSSDRGHLSQQSTYYHVPGNTLTWCVALDCMICFEFMKTKTSLMPFYWMPISPVSQVPFLLCVVFCTIHSPGNSLSQTHWGITYIYLLLRIWTLTLSKKSHDEILWRKNEQFCYHRPNANKGQ